MRTVRVRDLRATLLNFRFWVVVLMFAIGSFVYYPGLLGVSPPGVVGTGLVRHTLELVFLVLPVAYAGYVFRVGGGTISLAVAVAIMLPQALITRQLTEVLLQMGGVVLVGGMVNFWFESYRREQTHRQVAMQSLEATKQQLQESLALADRNAERLEAINRVSEIVSQTLELSEVLSAAVDTVRNLLKLDVALIFLVDERTQELELRACRGVSSAFAEGLRGLKVGEGFNGTVALTGQPLHIEDSSLDARLTREVVRQENLRAQLIIPLKAKDKVVGTLSVASRHARQFDEDEVDLLMVIGRQVGMAIENSRMYQLERSMARQEKQVQRTLRYYLRQVTRAQEEERQRIAQELHDDTVQALVILQHQLDEVVAGSGNLPREVTARLENIRQQIGQIAGSVRRFSQDLRPSLLDDLGLLPALEWLTADVSRMSGIDVEMKVSGTPSRFPPETELVLFRIVQEALRNVWKHSHATRATVSVEFDTGKTVLTVQDDGIGFTIPGSIEDLALAGKLGLAGMRERAQLIGARLNIESEPGIGTTIRAEMPVYGK